jgi:hypothetical protein
VPQPPLFGDACVIVHIVVLMLASCMPSCDLWGVYFSTGLMFSSAMYAVNTEKLF